MIPEGFDFTDPGLYELRVPTEELAELRRTAPVWWNKQPRGISAFDDEGYWVVTRHADVMEVSRNTDVFSSWENTAIIRFHPEKMDRERIEWQRFIMLNTDPPHHTQLRAIVSRGFTPRAVSNLRDALASKAEKIVKSALEKGSGDFVTEVACELPLQAIAELLGVPLDDRHKIFNWSNEMVGYDDPDFEGDPLNSAMELFGYSMAMAEERKACPMDDIVTKLVGAEVEGNLTSDEFGFFVIMLSVAGNETTRNSISHGMNAFFDFPDQWELFKAQRPKTTPDEIVRWATPVTVFQRTATIDTELGGQKIKKGDRVGIFYRSANFDEEVFDHPEQFDIMRSPNPHLGFGGSGAHYCLGANLARLQIDLMFNALADHMPNIRKLEAPKRLRSGWINGIKELRVQYA